ncbi:MAG: GNAT family N-acetyltransferase [Candidatus Eisenbacteria bacterium]|nr:GNAT family N-acetyltransferase [Candidatus Eisenbacteria bacterium]
MARSLSLHAHRPRDCSRRDRRGALRLSGKPALANSRKEFPPGLQAPGEPRGGLCRPRRGDVGGRAPRAVQLSGLRLSPRRIRIRARPQSLPFVLSLRGIERRLPGRRLPHVILLRRTRILPGDGAGRALVQRLLLLLPRRAALRPRGGRRIARVEGVAEPPPLMARPDDEMKTILATRRLVLREMGPQDLDAVAAMLADSEVMRYFPRCYTRDEARQWIERQQQRYRDDGCGYWLALAKPERYTAEQTAGRPVGQAGVLVQEIRGRPEYALGYIICRSHWEQGYATEAARACRDYVLQTLKRDNVYTLIRPENEASRAVAGKLGMLAEGEMTLAGFRHIIYAYTRHSQQDSAPPR